MKILRILPLLGLVFFSSMQTKAQVAQDTVFAHQYYASGDSLFNKGKYEQSLKFFEQARTIYEKYKIWNRYIATINKCANNHLRLGHIDKLIYDAKLALSMNQEHLSDPNLMEAESYYFLASGQELQGHKELSLKNFKESFHIYERLNAAINLVGRPIIAISQTFLFQGELDSASHYLNKALVSTNDEFKNNNFPIMLFQTIGITLFRKGYLNKSAENFAKAIPYAEAENNLRGLSDIYSSLAAVYYQQGAHELSLQYMHQSFSIVNRTLPASHPVIGGQCNNLGLLYEGIGEYTEAYSYFKQSEKNYIKNFGAYHLNTVIPQANLAKLFNKVGQYDSAIFYAKKALMARIKYSPKDYVNIARSQNLLGLAYYGRAQYDLALEYFERQLDGLKTANLGDLPVTAGSYNDIARTHVALSNLTQALMAYDSSLFTTTALFPENSPNENPLLDQYQVHEYSIVAITGKASTLSKLYDKNQNLSDLKLALKTYQLADSLIDQTRQSHQQYEDKIAVSRTASQVYEGAINVCLKLEEATADTSYRNLAFYFSEKSKAGALTEALSNLSAKSFGLIPDSVLHYERDIKIDLSFYKSQVQKEKRGNEAYDTTKVRRWEDKVFSLNRAIDSLTKALEVHYPRYHELKYQTNMLSVQDVQKRLEPGSALVEYFMGDSSIYTFTITRETYEVKAIPSHQVSGGIVKKMRAQLTKSTLGNADTRDSLLASSNQIYEKLVQPAISHLPKTIDKLIVIPHGELGYIPFDILLTSPTEPDDTGYGQQNYLLHQYRTQYGYSAALLFNDFDKKEVSKNDSFIAFAPSYDGLEIDSVRSLSLGRFRDQLTRLQWNQPEIEGISQYLNGVVLTGKDALESRFKSSTGQHSIIHLAMHALIDDRNPMNSKLVFTQEEDSLEDNFLHAYELYNMELPAQMAVLSACETGFGKLERGEGVMSLARAFSYAGCPSVVMSHWSVNDAATAKLMNHFYKYLSEGLPKDAALQQAKLEFLQNADPAQANPYYWGSFVVMGDTSPLKFESWWQKYWYAWLVVLVIVCGLMVWRRKGD